MALSQFLPSNYQTPSASSDYMKLIDGENKFRILSSPIIGWEEWVTEGAEKKCYRYRMNQKPAKPRDPAEKITHFWAFIVWNYAESKIQILTLRQVSIQRPIQGLCADEDWGAPFFYDIKIIRKVENQKTSYTVVALPHKPLSDIIKASFYEKRIDLNALFDGADPFAPSDTPTPAGWEDAPESAAPTVDGRGEMLRRFNLCDDGFKAEIHSFLDQHGIKRDFSNMKPELLERLARKIDAQLELKEVESDE